MRYDMSEVVTTRARAGGAYNYHDVRVRYKGMDIESLDDLPKNEGYRRPHRERKEFSDLLGPLEGFLRSRVGQKWDDVYSEIREQINPASTVHIHIMNHIFQFIYEKTFFGDDGNIYAVGNNRGFRGSTPFLVSWGDLYVHPITGIVCAMPERKKYHNPEYTKAISRLRYVFGNDWHEVVQGHRHHNSFNAIAESKKHIRIGFEKELHKSDGIWYWAVFADVPPPFTQFWITGQTKHCTIARSGTDYWTNKSQTEGRYRCDKRQANSRDLRRHGIRND